MKEALFTWVCRASSVGGGAAAAVASSSAPWWWWWWWLRASDSIRLRRYRCWHPSLTDRATSSRWGTTYVRVDAKAHVTTAIKVNSWNSCSCKLRHATSNVPVAAIKPARKCVVPKRPMMPVGRSSGWTVHPGLVSAIVRHAFVRPLAITGELWIYSVSQKKSPLRTCGNFSKTECNFSTKFHMPIIRSYLR